MEGFAVQVDEDSLDQSMSGMVHGKIFLSVGSKVFPDSEWDDFVVIILGWWLAEVKNILDGSGSFCCFRFMDGPYYFEAHRNVQGGLSVAFFRDGEQYDCDFPLISIHDFLQEILRASNKVARTCNSRGWRSKEISTLQRLIRELRFIGSAWKESSKRV